MFQENNNWPTNFISKQTFIYKLVKGIARRERKFVEESASREEKYIEMVVSTSSQLFDSLSKYICEKGCGKTALFVIRSELF